MFEQFSPQTLLIFHRGWARTSSTAPHSGEVLRHPKPSLPPGKSQESVEISVERSINFHRANSPPRGSGRTMKSRWTSQRGVDSDRSFQPALFSPRRLPSVWQLSFVRSNFYGDSRAHSAASLWWLWWLTSTLQGQMCAYSCRLQNTGWLILTFRKTTHHNCYEFG